MSERFYKVYDKLLEDTNLSYPEIILYGVIVRLSQNSEHRCFASNKALARIMNCSKSSVSKWLDKLTQYGYITRSLQYAKGTKYIEKRYITPVTIYTADLQEGVPSADKGVYHENDIGCTANLQEGIPPFYKDSKSNIDKRISKINEKEESVRDKMPVKSNNFFLNLAENGNTAEPF